MTGKKNDQNNYEKVDYSLIPIDIIEGYLNHEVHSVGVDVLKGIATNEDYQLFVVIHSLLNNPGSINDQIPIVFKSALSRYGVKYLAASLGMGLQKYQERNNWMKFDSDPDRFLRATLRHLIAIILGDTYDGEEVEGYSKGNDHRGAVCFSLMVANHIVNNRPVPPWVLS